MPNMGVRIKVRKVRQFMMSFSIIAKHSFLNSLVFRANYFVEILSSFLFLYLSIELWSFIYTNSNVGSTFGMASVLSYVSISRVIAKTDMEFVWHVQNRILTGEIASELVRPFNFSTYLMAQEVGRYFGYILFRVIPLFISTMLFINLYFPKQIINIILFFISVVLSFFLLFYINYITSLMAFWITKLFSLGVFKDQTIRLLSGSIVPLWFFPSQWVSVLQYTPFAGITFIPVTIYLETTSLQTAVWLILSQAFWIIILAIVAKRVWGKAIKNISINGG